MDTDEALSPKIITTNLDLKDIGTRYGERLEDGFKEMFESIAYTTQSYRV